MKRGGLSVIYLAIFVYYCAGDREVTQLGRNTHKRERNR